VSAARVVVFSGGDLKEPAFYRATLRKDDFVICADSGVRNARKVGVTPDVLIGDFDSSDLKELEESGKIETIVLPREKDRTDTHEAARLALARGFREILFLGALGGARFDHALANVELLAFCLENGAKASILDETNELFLFEREIEIKRKPNYKLSLFAVGGEAEGIDGEGLCYPLKNASLRFGNPYAVSNEFIAETARITVRKGRLLAVLSRDA
jgi:thiamine pyrophosphokinase